MSHRLGRLLGATALFGIGCGAGPALARSPDGVDLVAPLTTMAAADATAPAAAAMSAPFADQGAAAPDLVLDLTLYLKPADPDGLAALVRAVQAPGDPSFHRFLSEAAFVRRFAQSADTVGRVQQVLRAQGLAPSAPFVNRLAVRVSGRVADLNRAFGLNIHEVSRDGAVQLASTTQPSFPAAIAGVAEGLGGFETVIPSSPGPDRTAQSNGTGITTAMQDLSFDPGFESRTGVSNPPGSLLPLDFERIYDVVPVADRARGGDGRTVAIVTEQNFDPALPQQFWSRIGVRRTGSFTLRHVDGSEADATDEADESDLDTEQAGAIAPAAALIAYVTPTGAASLLDGYEAVASDDQADAVSSSFGTPEMYLQPNGTEVFNRTLLPAYRDVFEELAVQGETVFAAAGDAGAFDVNRDEDGYYQVFPSVGGPPAYTAVYSVNAIAASPLVTACGGTTLPFSGTDPTTSPALAVSVPAEQPWSDSYLPLAALASHALAQTTLDLLEAAFPTGGGGGVSTLWPVPSFQAALAGVTVSAPGQALIRLGGAPQVLARLPAGYAGRNLPDLSADADPHTGYLRLMQDGTGTPALTTEGGGTSYVAPQFAATMVLIDAALGHRVGQLDPLLYRLQADGAAPASPVRHGDNWGYAAHPGYNQAAGLGTMDGWRLYRGLASFD